MKLNNYDQLQVVSLSLWLWGAILENEHTALYTLLRPHVEQIGPNAFFVNGHDTVTEVKEK